MAIKGFIRVIPLFALFAAACSTPNAPPVWSWTRVTFDRDAVLAEASAGLADPRAGRELTPDNPVRIASISKLITTLGVMRLVERRVLDLDRDVSGWLGWPVRNPAHPDAPITLRHLLSHTSGLRDGDDIYIIPLGGDVRETIASHAAWDTRPPGAYFAYANLGFPVVASVIEAATGERFDRVMAREVFAPLELEGCFNWTTCSDNAVARAVVLRDEDGAVIRDDLQGSPPPCPVVPDAGGGCDLADYVLATNGALFSPQGGARVSARDLAVIGRVLLNRGGHEGSLFLLPESIDAMIHPVWRFDGSNGDTMEGLYCAYGLGVQLIATRLCGDDPFGDRASRFGHAGEAYGVISGLWIDPVAGRGIAYFATGAGEDRPRGHSSFLRLEEALIAGEPITIRPRATPAR